MDFTINGKAYPWIGGTMFAIVAALIIFYGLGMSLMLALLAFPVSYALSAIEHFKLARVSNVLSVLVLVAFLVRGLYLFAQGKPVAGLWFIIGFALFLGAELFIRRTPLEK